MDRLDLVVWSPGRRLSGLALATISGEAVTVRFVEGDPREGCPLKGWRAAIAIETAHCYAQACGRREVRVTPVNDRVAVLYRDILGFTLETYADGRAYYARRVP